MCFLCEGTIVILYDPDVCTEYVISELHKGVLPQSDDVVS